MSAPKPKSVRHHKKRTNDGKGERRMIAGKRFRLPNGISDQEVKKRFARIEDAWNDNELFCERYELELEWTYVALWAAEHIKHGQFRVQLPPIDEVLPCFEATEYPIELKLIIDRYTSDDMSCNYPDKIEGLETDEALKFHQFLTREFESVNWLLPERHADEIRQDYEKWARYSLEKIAKINNRMPPSKDTPLISGTYHEALTAFEEFREDYFTQPDGQFDGSGHHFLGIIQLIRERRPDFQLAELDFRRCQEEFRFWCDRPTNLRSSKDDTYLAKKTCQNYVGELDRFFKWLHLSSDFGWRLPEDFPMINRGVRSLPSDRRSIDEMEINTFSVDDLVLLYKFATPFERLLLVWCLNCAHGAAEFGRVEWRDVFLHQPHPWVAKGLKLESSDKDSWIGFTRPKSGVIGWWYLWPETIELLTWWRQELTKLMGKEPKKEMRVLLTSTGSPLYRDEARNAQTGFANAWTRLKKRIEQNQVGEEIEVPRLPFGSLRDQLPDWLGGEQANALVASVALCHGIPHKGDKLLYKHYSNRPWSALFQAQKEFRQHLKPMFAAVPDPFCEYDPLGDRIKELWQSGMTVVRQMSKDLGVSEMIIHRRLKKLGLK